MIKIVECRVIDSKPTDRPRRAVQVVAVTRRKSSKKAVVPKFVIDLYLRLDTPKPQLNTIA